jgi:shikimate kinase
MSLFLMEDTPKSAGKSVECILVSRIPLKTGLKSDPALGLAAVVQPGNKNPSSGKLTWLLFP